MHSHNYGYHIESLTGNSWSDVVWNSQRHDDDVIIKGDHHPQHVSMTESPQQQQQQSRRHQSTTLSATGHQNRRLTLDRPLTVSSIIHLQGRPA